jgi:hypothetical protein
VSGLFSQKPGSGGGSDSGDSRGGGEDEGGEEEGEDLRVTDNEGAGDMADMEEVSRIGESGIMRRSLSGCPMMEGRLGRETKHWKHS